MVGWGGTGKTVQPRLGDPMEFISCEDTSGIFDTAFFPQV